MDLENSEFLKFVKAAGDNNLEYLLIGGLALAMHGIIRYTQDADIWVKPTNENRDNLIKTLSALDYEDDDYREIANLDFREPQIVRLEGPIDILTRVHFRMGFDECMARAREFTSSIGYKLYFVHINDLREFKVWARRPKDLNDILMIDELIEKINQQDSEKS
ncbi:hypothetical protein [Dyadobacter sandarakinus]|uniref:Nucleotidyl transferase AbiEii toxin, Type IV TA system n=1 Tax=Dyadobacter sandarakinus TaxID=2747268 RepID=A0ABX7I7Q5_9BACT|nr:hypothetical protein [Dyadobacter sandarakinus]QRR02132.1 hypothetical protein HWI92_15070 [Dyadobacter sandarakinus]